MNQLPYNAEWMRAAQKRSPLTIVFVHHFGGSKRTVLRHVKMVNELGYDAIRFDLILQDQTSLKNLFPITADLKVGMRHFWAQQVEAILNAIEGPKVLFTFSMPSTAAIEAIGQRNAQDVRGWICDGGPFSQLLRCTWNLFQHEYKVKSQILRGVLTVAATAVWGLHYERDLKASLAQIPARFPVLSIRGGKDPLVPEMAIEEFFDLQDHLSVQVYVIPEAHHLDGIKVAPAEYRDRIATFLKTLRTT